MNNGRVNVQGLSERQTIATTSFYFLSRSSNREKLGRTTGADTPVARQEDTHLKGQLSDDVCAINKKNVI